jgi:hypothetical protein
MARWKEKINNKKKNKKKNLKPRSTVYKTAELIVWFNDCPSQGSFPEGGEEGYHALTHSRACIQTNGVCVQLLNIRSEIEIQQSENRIIKKREAGCSLVSPERQRAGLRVSGGPEI